MNCISKLQASLALKINGKEAITMTKLFMKSRGLRLMFYGVLFTICWCVSVFELPNIIRACKGG